MSTRIKVEQLEQMTTHELAELLGNVVMLLRRLPDVTWKELQPSLYAGNGTQDVPAETLHPRVLMQEELNKMKVADLREIAKDLHIPNYSKAKRDDLITRILARQSHTHSEQYAIQEL